MVTTFTSVATSAFRSVRSVTTKTQQHGNANYVHKDAQHAQAKLCTTAKAATTIQIQQTLQTFQLDLL